jgi:RNA polymerase sigma factor (TIGR02999 family)
MRSERPGHTLQATALVHEAYARLAGSPPVEWRNRAHFIGVAANVMRRILIDHARSRKSEKHGGLSEKLPLLENDQFGYSGQQCGEVLIIDQALERLAKLDPDQAKVVELRFFGGLSVEETAEVLGLSPRTVKRYWLVARGWLRQQLGQGSWDDSGAMAED